MADKSLVDRLVDESDHVNSEWWYVPHELLSAVEVAMRASDRRIEALTKALREATELLGDALGKMDSLCDYVAESGALRMVGAREVITESDALLKRAVPAMRQHKALASAAGAEGEA